MADDEDKGLVEKGKEVTEDALSEILEWALDKSSMGYGPVDSAKELAEDYIGKHGTIREDAEELVNYQVAKAASAGFLTGLFGPAALIVGLPVNLTAAAFIQLRMIVAIAYMAGYDINDDRVKTLCLICLCGKAASNILKEAGVLAGQRLLIAVANKFAGNAVERAYRVVASKLIVGSGVKAAGQAGKLIPLLGGVINGAIDGVYTRSIGVAAIEVFVGENDSKALAKRVPVPISI